MMALLIAMVQLLMPNGLKQLAVVAAGGGGGDDDYVVVDGGCYLYTSPELAAVADSHFGAPGGGDGEKNQLSWSGTNHIQRYTCLDVI